jgi:hypothetical protein
MFQLPVEVKVEVASSTGLMAVRVMIVTFTMHYFFKVTEGITPYWWSQSKRI